MASTHKEEEEEDSSRKVEYPLNPNSYNLGEEIGRGISSRVYKAVCVPLKNCSVAIKSIPLDDDELLRKSKITPFRRHPNILNPYCSFPVGDHSIWILMPLVSPGSLKSIMAASFPQGLPEPCLAIVLKETLSALAFLRGQGYHHRDVKASNILLESNGAVKLADFGVSPSIHDLNLKSLTPSTHVDRILFWIAPEVIRNKGGAYGFEADIWSFGLTAIELAHGRRPPFPSYETNYCNKCSKVFKDMVGPCLFEDPSRRPSPEELLKHEYFNNCRDPDFLAKNLQQGFPRNGEPEIESKEHEISVVSSSSSADQVDSRMILNKEALMESLLSLKDRLDDQRKCVMDVIDQLGGGNKLELIQMIQKLVVELENGKRNTAKLVEELQIVTTSKCAGGSSVSDE